MLKYIKQCSISNFFSTLAYKKNNVRLLKMLHTKSNGSRQMEFLSRECACCSDRNCAMCPVFWNAEERNQPKAHTPELAERISRAAEQENYQTI